METWVWILTAIFVLNVAVVAWLVALELVERYRLHREIREVDALWRSLTMPRTGGAVLGTRGGARGRHGATPFRAFPALSGPVGKASVGLALAATALWVVVAATDLGGRRTIIAARGAESLAVPPEWEEQLRQASARRASTVPIAGLTPAIQSDGPATSSDENSEGVMAPDSVAAHPRSSTAIRVVWTDVPSAIAYEVERRGEDSPAPAWMTIARVEESVTAFTDGGLESDTTYFYRVAAVTEAGPAPPSEVASATTPIAPPAAVTLTAVAVSTGIELTWTDVADETGYRIERSLDGSTGWATIETTGQDITVYADAGLAPGGTYHYRIVATNAGGDSAPSNVAAATIATNLVPPLDGPGKPSPGATTGDEDPPVIEESPVPDPDP